jgi:hypothetical protein
MSIPFPKLTPESFIMLSVAFIIDLIGLLLLCCGIDDCGLLDLVGIFIIGGWMIFKTKKVKKPAGKGRFLSKLFTDKYSKFLVTFGIEEIPYIGGFSFTWTAAVYFTLVVQDEQNKQIEEIAQFYDNISKNSHSSGSPSGV